MRAPRDDLGQDFSICFPAPTPEGKDTQLSWTQWPNRIITAMTGVGGRGHGSKSLSPQGPDEIAHALSKIFITYYFQI